MSAKWTQKNKDGVKKSHDDNGKKAMDVNKGPPGLANVGPSHKGPPGKGGLWYTGPVPMNGLAMKGKGLLGPPPTPHLPGPYFYNPASGPQPTSGPAAVWAAAMWMQKGKSPIAAVPWAGKGGMGNPGGTSIGKGAEKATWKFCQGEFWYASTNKAFDETISTTGIDCSKGKYRGCVFCQKSLEAAEATAMKFGIERVHKIDLAAMWDYYGPPPKSAGGVIWIHGPLHLDFSELPPADRYFVRPQFIESFPVRSQAGSATGTTPSGSPEVSYKAVSADVGDDEEEIPADLRTSAPPAMTAAALATNLASALKSQSKEDFLVVPAPIPAVSSILYPRPQSDETFQDAVSSDLKVMQNKKTAQAEPAQKVEAPVAPPCEEVEVSKDEAEERRLEEVSKEHAAAHIAEAEVANKEDMVGEKNIVEKKKKKKRKEQSARSVPSMIHDLEGLEAEGSASPSISRAHLLLAFQSMAGSESPIREALRVETLQDIEKLRGASPSKMEVTPVKTPEKSFDKAAKTPPPWRNKAGPPSPTMSPVKEDRDRSKSGVSDGGDLCSDMLVDTVKEKQ